MKFNYCFVSDHRGVKFTGFWCVHQRTTVNSVLFRSKEFQSRAKSPDSPWSLGCWFTKHFSAQTSFVHEHLHYKLHKLYTTIIANLCVNECIFCPDCRAQGIRSESTIAKTRLLQNKRQENEDKPFNQVRVRIFCYA